MPKTARLQTPIVAKIIEASCGFRWSLCSQQEVLSIKSYYDPPGEHRIARLIAMLAALTARLTFGMLAEEPEFRDVENAALRHGRWHNGRMIPLEKIWRNGWLDVVIGDYFIHRW